MVDQDTERDPRYAELRQIYVDIGFSVTGLTAFAANMAALGLEPSDDPWLDAHIRFLRRTVSYQGLCIVAAIPLALFVGASAEGVSVAAVLCLMILAITAFFLRYRLKSGASAFLAGKPPP